MTAPAPVEVAHTCAGIDHVTLWTPERVVKLGRGVRLEGRRCDGTRMHVIVGRTTCGEQGQP